MIAENEIKYGKQAIQRKCR